MGKYAVLKVDEDCVRMSNFIETKLNCEFEDRKAFYEAEKEEDLLYCKKILHPKKDKVASCCWSVHIENNQIFVVILSNLYGRIILS